MECREVQSLIGKYIDGTMTDKKMLEFIQHVLSCRTCYDELETYFVIHYAIKYLDEDFHASCNFQNMLKEDLKRRESNIRSRRSARFSMSLYFGFIILIFIFVSLYIFLPEEANYVLKSVDELNDFLQHFANR